MRTSSVRALILGSGGFTGRHLVERLRRDDHVQVFEASPLGLDLLKRDTIAKVLRDVNPDLVVNLAAVSYVASDDVRPIYELNSFGHLHLLEALVELDFGGRVVFASSANIYGNMTVDAIREDRCPAPVNHYAISKVLAESFCRLFADRLDIAIVRPFNCIGAGQAPQFLVPKIIRHFLERAPRIDLGNIDIERDFIDIRDVAQAYELVMFTPVRLGAVNVSTNTTHSIKEIISMLVELTGHQIEIRTESSLLRQLDLLHQQGDNTKLCTLGFRPRYSLRDTLRWMLSVG